jgi:cytochrome c2
VKIGPGLKGILTREKLPVSGKPATPENVIHQLKEPFKDMPSFRSSLSEQDINDLIAYLKTL